MKLPPRHYSFLFYAKQLLLLFVLFHFNSCSEPKVIDKNVALSPVSIDSDIGLLHEMQGRWIDFKNDEAILEVNGIHLISEYQGDVMNIQEIIVAKEFPENCQGVPNEGGIGFFITKTDEGPFCYQILELNENRIRYEAVGLID